MENVYIICEDCYNNVTSLLKPGNTTYNTVLLDAKMLQLAASNKPEDKATLAHIWGYPLVTVAGSYNANHSVTRNLTALA